MSKRKHCREKNMMIAAAVNQYVASQWEMLAVEQEIYLVD